MSLFDWFASRRKETPLSKDQQMREIADGLWQKCQACDVLTYTKDLKANFGVCPSCGHHTLMSAAERIQMLVNPGSWQALDDWLVSSDPLGFVDQKTYPDRVKSYQEKTGLKDAILTGLADIEDHRVALGVMDFSFMGGTVGCVVGEKIARLAERATHDHIPLIICAASGGARMQEGILSLVQIAKTAAAVQKHHAAGQLFISVLTNPTMGGVSASFGMLGHLIVAEPKAVIGFAGRRVIEQTIGTSKLPEDFQTSEYLLAHGLIDAIVPRTELRKRLSQLLDLHRPSGSLPLAKRELPLVASHLPS